VKTLFRISKANPSKANKASPGKSKFSTPHLDLRHSGSYQRQGQLHVGEISAASLSPCCD